MNLIAGNHLPLSFPYSYEVSKFVTHGGMCITDAQKANICNAVVSPTVCSVLTLALRNVKRRIMLWKSELSSYEVY